MRRLFSSIFRKEKLLSVTRPLCAQCEERRRWFHLTAQEVQPLYYESDLGEGSWLRSRGCLEEAWSGGGSLVLDGLFPAAGTEPLRVKCVPLFFPWVFLFPTKKTPIHRCRVYPPPDRIFSLNVVLPTRTLVVLVCKPSAGVEASLVLRTADASQLAHADIPDDECRFLTVASVIVQGLLELHVIERKGTTA